MVKFIVEEVLRRIVLLTSSGSSVNPDVFVITVPTFAIRGSTSNLRSTEFQSSPVPARLGYPPVAPLIASVISVSTYSVVAKRDVSVMPCTFVVSDACSESAFASAFRCPATDLVLIPFGVPRLLSVGIVVDP
jgi:hypothetical protein